MYRDYTAVAGYPKPNTALGFPAGTEVDAAVRMKFKKSPDRVFYFVNDIVYRYADVLCIYQRI